MARFFGTLTLAAGLLLVAAPAAGAAVFDVTQTKDKAGVCDEKCALREAALAAGETMADDVIVLRAGTYGLTREGADEDAGLTGDLDLAEQTPAMQSAGTLLIRGRGAMKTKIDANGVDRAIQVLDEAAGAGSPVELRRLAVRGGRIDEDGGGVRVEDQRALGLESALITDNRTTEAGNDGGGIENRGALTLSKSTVRGNRAGGDGGGISMNGGDSLSLERSTVSGNLAGNQAFGGDGGGIYSPSGVSSTIENSTISGNRSRGPSSQGGGIYASGGSSMDLTSVTVAFNDSSDDIGGGIYNPGADVDLLSTIVARNEGQPGNHNCGGDGPGSLGSNLEDRDTCALGGAGDLPDASPGMTALASNGGPTQTHALKGSSDAVDAGDAGSCPPTDQRGVDRPQGAECDIGAFERGD